MSFFKAKMPNQGCKRPPSGWYCSRTPDHTGPCATYPRYISASFTTAIFFGAGLFRIGPFVAIDIYLPFTVITIKV